MQRDGRWERLLAEGRSQQAGLRSHEAGRAAGSAEPGLHILRPDAPAPPAIGDAAPQGAPAAAARETATNMAGAADRCVSSAPSTWLRRSRRWLERVHLLAHRADPVFPRRTMRCSQRASIGADPSRVHSWVRLGRSVISDLGPKRAHGPGSQVCRAPEQASFSWALRAEWAAGGAQERTKSLERVDHPRPCRGCFPRSCRGAKSNLRHRTRPWGHGRSSQTRRRPLTSARARAHDFQFRIFVLQCICARTSALQVRDGRRLRKVADRCRDQAHTGGVVHGPGEKSRSVERISRSRPMGCDRRPLRLFGTAPSNAQFRMPINY